MSIIEDLIKSGWFKKNPQEIDFPVDKMTDDQWDQVIEGKSVFIEDGKGNVFSIKINTEIKPGTPIKRDDLEIERLPIAARQPDL